MPPHDDRDFECPSGPTRAWLFAQAVLGRPIPNPREQEECHASDQAQLRWVEAISGRSSSRTVEVEPPGSNGDQQGEFRRRLAARSEATERVNRHGAQDARQYWELLYEASRLEEAWDPSKHPRAGGPPNAGWWAKTGGGEGPISAGPTSSARPDGHRPGQSHSASVPTSNKQSNAPLPTPAPTTKTHLPANHRGTWIRGTREHGTFRYHDTLDNGIVAGKEFRFENQHIAVGGFPPEAYYGGSAAQASVEIEKVRGNDNRASNAAMRKKLGNPDWTQPTGFAWNHAGQPGSKTMELVDLRYHKATAHKGPAAEPRAASAAGATGRAVGALTVYLAVRDSLQAAGVLEPDYEVSEREVYHFTDVDGSRFIVNPGGLFSGATREFVAGPRKGRIEKISSADVEQYRKQGEAEFGKYIPGTLFQGPRFIPGRQRSSLPLFGEKDGVPYQAGRIDKDGVHRFKIPMALSI